MCFAGSNTTCSFVVGIFSLELLLLELPQCLGLNILSAAVIVSTSGRDRLAGLPELFEFVPEFEYCIKAGETEFVDISVGDISRALLFGKLVA